MTAATDKALRDAGLFSPTTVGALALSHRVVHAPMTRLRAEPDLSPSPVMVEYYRQRASAGGLLITESAHPTFDSRGYLGAPGMYTDRHVAGWRAITDAVHAKGGLIVMQIAHDGRQSHVDLSWGRPSIAPSVVPFETQVLTQNGWVPNSPHRALDLEEIPPLVESFRRTGGSPARSSHLSRGNCDRRGRVQLVVRWRTSTHQRLGTTASSQWRPLGALSSGVFVDSSGRCCSRDDRYGPRARSRCRLGCCRHHDHEYRHLRARSHCAHGGSGE
jgi:NADH:flavin oxidoreductase / NADH oxidase family